MFRKSHAEEFVEKLGTIKTYKTYKEKTKYKSHKIKQLESIMTLHHFQHRADGGSTSAENGAIINELAHRYMHSLPRNQEEIINDYIREWKKRNFGKCEIMIVDDIEKCDFEIDLAEVELEKELIIKPFNRAKNKRETKKAYEEYLDELGG
jgi:hypothetical protein